MNTDIRISVSFKGHRKLKKLRRAIGDRAAEYLLNLWISAATDAPKGVLAGWTDEDVADAADWQGEPLVFAEALISCVFLERDADGSYVLHDWCQWQGWACGAMERSGKAKAAANARWEKRNAGSNAPSPSLKDKLPPQPPAGGSEGGEEGKGENGQPPDPPLPTVADLPERTEQAGKPKRAKLVDEGVVFFRSLRPDWITETQWEEIICWRVRKKTAMTQRAASTLIKELLKSRDRGFTVDQVLDLLSKKPWSSYEDRYLDNQQMQPAAPRQPVCQDGAAPRPMPNSRELAERLAQERYDADMKRNQPENEQEGG